MLFVLHNFNKQLQNSRICKNLNYTLDDKTKTIKHGWLYGLTVLLKIGTLKNCIAKNYRFDQSETIKNPDIIYKYMLHFRFCLQDIHLYYTHKSYW